MLLSKENKKFIYGVIKEGARAKDFELAIQRLTDAGLLHKVYNTNKPALPLVAYQELSAFKLFHNDVGLLGAMSRLNAKTIAVGDNIFSEYNGALTEQYVFQQLTQNETLSVYYHTFDNSKYELDFLVQTANGEIIPIEVKVGENLTSNYHFSHVWDLNENYGNYILKIIGILVFCSVNSGAHIPSCSATGLVQKSYFLSGIEDS